MTLLIILLVVVLPAIVNGLWPYRAKVSAAIPPAPAGTYRVYIADWGYHTSVIIQQPPGWKLGSLGRETAPFVEYAWGDRRYYMESDHRPQSLFAALFLPTEAVTYVASWTTDPARIAHPRALYVREVNERELDSLASALESSIPRDSAGQRSAPFASVSDYAGRFYRAYGRYLWWSDCNRWTVERLASVHLARGGPGVIFSGQVRGHLIGFRRVSAPQATAMRLPRPSSQSL
ncbi:MAG: DUF2459 domain-containing protein [Gemmatimonadaceae bacterium]